MDADQPFDSKEVRNMPALTAAEVSAYHDKGYVVPDYRVPPAQLAELTAAL